MYSVKNFKTKKQLVAAVRIAPVACYQPGPFGPDVVDGEHCWEAPHYPAPHMSYATVRVRSGYIVAVKTGRQKSEKAWTSSGCYCRTPDAGGGTCQYCIAKQYKEETGEAAHCCECGDAGPFADAIDGELYCIPCAREILSL